MADVKIDTSTMSSADWEISMPIMRTAVKRFFDMPGVRDQYERWMQTEEGQRSEARA